IVSDRRVKKDITPFKDGLGVVSKINPVRYRYTGAAGMPKDMEGIGIVAQEIKEVAPYTVGSFRAKLDEKDPAETELYSFNSHALTFVMINAIKELDQRTRGLAPLPDADATSLEGSSATGRATGVAALAGEGGPQTGRMTPAE